MKKKEFSISNVGGEFLKQKPNKSVCKIANVMGLKFFSMLLMNSELQGLHIVFPKKSTLQKIVMRAQIRDELRGLKGEKFETKIVELCKLFGLFKHQVLEEFRLSKGRERYEK